MNDTPSETPIDSIWNVFNKARALQILALKKKSRFTRDELRLSIHYTENVWDAMSEYSLSHLLCQTERIAVPVKPLVASEDDYRNALSIAEAWIIEVSQATKQDDAEGKVDKAHRQKKRRKTAKRKPAPITKRQHEAMLLYGELKADYKAVGERMGISRQAATNLIRKGFEKVGDSGLSLKDAKRCLLAANKLPHDRRGQPTVEEWRTEESENLE